MTTEVDTSLLPSCEDCGKLATEEAPLDIIAADLGKGAFLAVLCESCWHRRQYRAELKKRARQKL